MRFLKLQLLFVFCLGTQTAMAEYISCTITDNGSYLYLDTPSLSLNIPEPLPIPGNDNAFKGTFKMTEAASGKYVALVFEKANMYQNCENEKIFLRLDFKAIGAAQLSVSSECPESSYNFYESNLVCTHH